MTDTKELLIAILTPLLDHPDSLTITIQDTPEFMEYHIRVANEDMGRVIGRKGATISAIRTIVHSIPVVDKKVRLIVDED